MVRQRLKHLRCLVELFQLHEAEPGPQHRIVLERRVGELLAERLELAIASPNRPAS